MLQVAWGHIAPVLIGYPKDTLAAAEKRLRAVGKPFAMHYRDAQGQADRGWRQFQRLWARPAIMRQRLR